MNAEMTDNRWSHTALLWMIGLVWFCSNLLSQAIFMGMNGHPYGIQLIINEIGNLYWALFAFELVVYLVISSYFFKKFSNSIKWF